MSRATPKMRNFAERLIAYETRGNNPSETETSGPFLVGEKLRPQLATLMGNVGFRALLSRALALERFPGGLSRFPPIGDFQTAANQIRSSLPATARAIMAKGYSTDLRVRVVALVEAGDSCRSPLEQHKRWLLDLVAAEPDLILDEIVARLASAKKLKVGRTSIWRFYDRHHITFKKNIARSRTGSA